ncbi:MAG: glycosyltransferase family 4 protein, partial [Chitinophagaceae bacterium]
IKPLPALEKKPGELVLGTIALISPMKNHLEVIKALLLIRQSVTWFVYGPVKDEQYWAECLAMLKQLPLNIKVEYKGEIHPTQIERALSEVHVFIMPSKSENFGHSVMEALQAAKPVITTNSTPFKQLSELNAGVTINSNQLEAELPVAIKKFAIMNMGEYEVCCRNANVYAQQLLSKTVLREQYKTLFQ